MNMIDMKNFGPTPRTGKDAFEKYLQTSSANKIAAPAWRDALDLFMAACIAVAIGAMLAWSF
jgi:hypothetical protein